MAYDVKMLADSISPDGVRLCTQQVTFPRFILAEVNTHREFSRNSASSRAMPVEKNIDRALLDPFVPEAFGANQKGMQAGGALDDAMQALARNAWLGAFHACVWFARILAGIGVHKQWANRVIEVWLWHTALLTATAWENWDNLRDNPQASPEIQVMARMMKESRAASTPQKLGIGEWHLPLTFEEDYEGIDHAGRKVARTDTLVKLSVARCARVSYLTHDGKRDVEADRTLYDRLVTSGHMSPLEHAVKVASDEEIDRYALWKKVDAGMNARLGNGAVARVYDLVPVRIGNLSVPWLSHRKMIPGEDVFRRST